MELSLEVILRALKKAAVLMIILAIIAGACAYFVSEYYIAPIYCATAKINIIGNANAESLTEINNSHVYANRIVKTCIVILQAGDFSEAVKEAAAVDHSPSLSFSYNEETTIIEITASDVDPNTAFKLASVAAELTETYLVDKNNAELISVKPVETPKMPKSPVSPSPVKNALIAFVCVAFVVLAIQVIRELFGTKVKNEAELSRRYNIPVIASIPDFNTNSKNYAKHYYYGKSRRK